MSENWKKVLPILSDEIEMGNVFKFDSQGNASYLTEELKNEIYELEKANEGIRIVAVLTSFCNLSESAKLKFIDFLIISDEEEPEVSEARKNTVEFFSFVKNINDPDSSEFGYVGVREESFGFVTRVY